MGSNPNLVVGSITVGGMGESIHLMLGLSDAEAERIEDILGRRPNHLELAMYAVMWSEHCSYKSSRVHLKRLPTSGPGVLVGPGENAGVIDAGEGVAVALRIESHNHPSALEPYQGAATGVGGILRDIFTMGARPIAIMDPLRFGPPDDPRSRWMLEGVVSGISGYGNSVGVPTLGGEIEFDLCYSANPLVNVLCLGVMPTSRLVLARASGPGNLAVLLGSATGRDGIGGVSVLASAGFSDDTSKRPSVQVGDPFEEKRLIEACLELLDTGLVVGVQDLGGAGLTCATSETASRGGVGMDVNLAAVPRREEGMEAFEVMTSESQERMLAIVEPASLDRVKEICGRWEINAAVVGRVTAAADGPGRLRVLSDWDGDVLADVPAPSLADDGPVYHRPMAPPPDQEARWSNDPSDMDAPLDCGADVLAMLVDPSWIFRQYDHQLFLNTVEGPGGDAAVIRLAAPGLPDTGKGLALSTDGNSAWCSNDPRRGTAMLVAESALNVACAGATPAAVVNCLNFGNPEHPEVMWQLSESIDGMAEACVGLGLPVVGGNVSFYNESGGVDIHPTPVIGTVGLIADLSRRPPGVGLVDGQRLVMVGATHGPPNLAGSRWAVGQRSHRGGRLLQVDLVVHATLIQFVAGLVAAQVASDPQTQDGVPPLGGSRFPHGAPSLGGIHDISDGGLGLALAEMAVRSQVGFHVSGVRGHGDLFNEAPSRVVICVADDEVETLRAAVEGAGLGWRELGRAGGDRLVIDGLLDLAMEQAREAWRCALTPAGD